MPRSHVRETNRGSSTARTMSDSKSRCLLPHSAVEQRAASAFSYLTIDNLTLIARRSHTCLPQMDYVRCRTDLRTHRNRAGRFAQRLRNYAP
jgi:hypothetical protein